MKARVGIDPSIDVIAPNIIWKCRLQMADILFRS